jgi:hypothetical protein
MTGVNNFPDGVANDGRIIVFVNPKAPEENYPESHGEDLTWVAGVGGAKGLQPITSTNPNGDYAGVSPMSAGLADIMATPDISGDGLPDPGGPGSRGR